MFQYNTVGRRSNIASSARLEMIRKLTAKHSLQRFPRPPVHAIAPKEIPTPKGLPFVGSTLSLLAAGSTPKLHLYIDARHKQLGPIFQEKLGPTSAVFVSNPDVMRAVFSNEGKYPAHVLPEPWLVYNKIHGCSRGLFFMDGEEWLQNRRKLNKVLLKGDIQWIENACGVATTNLIKNIKKASLNREHTPNLEALLYRWSLDVMIAIVVGDKMFEETQDAFGKDLEKLAGTVHLIFETTSKLELIPATLAQKLGLQRWKNFESSVDDALGTAREFVNKILMGNLDKEGLLMKMVEEDMDRELIIRIVTDLVLAAADTTAYSMAWILYLLSKYPHVQDELHEDLQKNPNSTLPKNITREALRLYPVAPFLTRFLPEDANIGGYRISKNTLIILSIYTSGRDEKYFENPEEFLPNRWSREQNGNIKHMLQATMPFAIGARSCIGRKIAEVQLQTGLSDLTKEFAVTLKNQEEIEMIMKMVAVPSKPIKLEFTERQCP